MSKRLKDGLGVAYSFFFAFIMIFSAFAICGILPGGKSIAWNTDTIEQTAAFGKMVARHIKEGGSLFYSWDTSLGQNTALINVGAYGPALIFYLLIEDAYMATLLGIAFKLAASAMFFYVFLTYGLEWKGRWNIFFALCYAFCGFSMEYMMAAGLLDAMYMLPLIMWALLRSYKEKKFLLLGIVYAFSFVTEMYMAFLTGIFSAAAFILYLLLKEGRIFSKKNLSFLAAYAISVLAAILLSMLLLLPAIMCVLLYGGYGSDLSLTHISPTDLLYSLFFGRPTSLKSDIPFLYCGLPVVFLLPVYFANGKISSKERLIIGGALVSIVVTLYIDPIYLFLHVFTKPDGFTVRYAFVYVFAMVVTAARAAYRIESAESSIKIRRLILYMSLMLVTAIGLILVHDNIGEVADGKGVLFALKGNLIFIPLWALTFSFWVKTHGKRGVTVAAYALLCVELMAQACFNIGEMGLLDAGWIEDKDAQMTEFTKAVDEYTKNNKEPYRAYAAAFPGYNQSAWYGFMGIEQFSSSHYAGVNRFMGRLGNYISDASYDQRGATDLTDMLLGVRYRGRLTDTGEMGGPAFEEYAYALPLGYMCSYDLLNGITDVGDPFEYQNRLVSAFCGEDLRPYVAADIYAHEETNTVYEAKDDGYIVHTVNNGEYGDVLFGIPKGGYLHAYAYFQIFPHGEDKYLLPKDTAFDAALFSNDDRKGNGSRFTFITENAVMEMTADGNAFVIRMADYDGPEKYIRYKKQYFYYQDEECLEKIYMKLMQGAWTTEEFRDGYIKAKVRSEEDKLLFMSIACDTGWNAYVDGKKAELIPVIDDAFMALDIEAGEHEIILEYKAPGVKAGLVLTGMGVILMFLMAVMSRFVFCTKQ